MRGLLLSAVVLGMASGQVQAMDPISLVPEGAVDQSFVGEFYQDGVRVSIATFTATLTPESVEQRYVQTIPGCDSNDLDKARPCLRFAADGTLYISWLTDALNHVVQLSRGAKGGTDGVISIADLDDRVALEDPLADLHGVQRQTQSRHEAHGKGQTVLTVYRSNNNAERTLAAIHRKLSADGWVSVLDQSDAEISVLRMVRGEREVMMATVSAQDGWGTSIVTEHAWK